MRRKSGSEEEDEGEEDEKGEKEETEEKEGLFPVSRFWFPSIYLLSLRCNENHIFATVTQKKQMTKKMH